MKRGSLKNQKFGRLLVLEDAGNTDAGHSKWNCRCDCGKEVVRTATSLKRSSNSSCGCYKTPSGKDSKHWNGCGEISGAWFHSVVYRAASGRKSRSSIAKKIDIDPEYIWGLFLKQNRLCALSGIELSFPKTGRNEDYKMSTASLDRIDSSMGYVKGNVQWVHKTINIMKNVYSQDVFIEMCKKVSQNNESEIK